MNSVADWKSKAVSASYPPRPGAQLISGRYGEPLLTIHAKPKPAARRSGKAFEAWRLEQQQAQLGRLLGIHLPELPPTVNDLYMPVRGRFVLKPTARKWLERTRSRVALLRLGPPLVGPVEWEITFTFPTIASDCTNRVKALEDALTGFAWLDDNQVVDAHPSKRLGRPGCIITVRASELDDDTAEKIWRASYRRSRS